MFECCMQMDAVKLFQQECIPVECVPAARRPYAGVCFPGGGGVSGLGGCVSSPGGVSGWGVSGLGGEGVVCLVLWCAWSRGGGVSGLGGGWCVWSRGGVCLVQGVCLSALWDTTPQTRHTTPPL